MGFYILYIMRLPFNSVWYSIKDYLIIIFGLLLYALGWVGFLIPTEITTGGVTGISALIYYGTGIHISVSYFVINVLLLLAANQGVGSSILHTNYFQRNRMFFILVYSSFVHKRCFGRRTTFYVGYNRRYSVRFGYWIGIRV